MGTFILVKGADFSANSLGTVTPSGTVPPQSLSIIGPSIVTGQATYKVYFDPVNTTQRGITWSITSGSSYASITATGVVSAKVGAVTSPVTIRATSTADVSIYSEKTISVTFGTITYYDYLQGDGTGYLLVPGLSGLWGATLTAVGTIPNANGYLFGIRLASDSTQARAGAYKSSGDKLSILFGRAGFVNSSVMPGSTTKYRFVLKGSTNSSTADATGVVYNADTSAAVYTKESQSTNIMTFSGVLGILTFGTGGSVDTYVPSTGTQSTGKIYSLKVEDSGGNTVLNLLPASLEGTPGMMETISGTFYPSATGVGLTVGND